MSQTSIRVRDWVEADLPVLHVINEASVPGVGSLRREALEQLVINQSAATLVAEGNGEPIGFVLCMVDGLDYASLNYKWLSGRYDQFAYIDRVAVAENQRGKHVGAVLYDALIARFAGIHQVLLAEVNLAPPNPGSLRFHKRQGFRDVGERWESEGQKGVVYLERRL